MRYFLKRALDFLVSTLALAVMTPLLLAIGVCIWASMGRPVLFVQMRTGLHGRLFGLIKFRTMLADPGLSDAHRITRLGAFLRKYSIDELPQLLNVLLGSMSLVGPRPLLPEYLPLYSSEQMRRHLVKPGITGWAQINGRNAISWDKKFELDAWYVEHWSVWLDIKIISLTFLHVISPRGIGHGDAPTMPPFGSPNDRIADKSTGVPHSDGHLRKTHSR